jgi:hypothetical protein
MFGAKSWFLIGLLSAACVVPDVEVASPTDSEGGDALQARTPEPLQPAAAARHHLAQEPRASFATTSPPQTKASR